VKMKRMTRREWLASSGTALGALTTTRANTAAPSTPLVRTESQNDPQESPRDIADRVRRMQWWREARFGMFVHWGLYSLLERHEWVMENEGIPASEYAPLAMKFKPQPHAAQVWAKLAKQAGQKYMVMTTKHHEGFCNFDASKYTDYCAPKQGPGRDLVRGYVEAARAEGLRVGFYYSLMDWHHPDGARCATDEEARRRFVEYTHGLICELMTNYGRIDVLWYDVAWPLDAEGWESERMNRVVFQLQPDIIVNNRNKLPGDFSTPEQEVTPAQNGRAWESCMTINDSWGYQRADDDWKNSRRIIQNLISCVRDGGNYLLNIGPRADGSIPEPEVRVLSEVGEWLGRNGEAIYHSDLCQPRRSNYASFTRRGSTLYMHVHFWPGDYVAVAGLMKAAAPKEVCEVKSARLLASGRKVNFVQDRFRVRFTGLPNEAPDYPVTTIAIECDSEPMQDNLYVRNEKPRDSV